ncbi:MAG: hypothetical protein KKB25_00570 [Nanoarchaeota archaeon]|nr:hypothetical protein [Nanoarchaeota archaeon]
MRNNGVRKAQAALEYMMIIGMVLVILMPMVISIFQQIETVSRSRHAEIAALRISSTASNIYAQGPGAKSTINIFLPDGYSNMSYVSGNVILIKVYIPGGFNDVVKISTANLTGTLPADSGYKQITLEMLQNGTVMVG